MSIEENNFDKNRQEKSEEELLEEKIIKLRDSILIAHLSQGGKLKIPINKEALKETIIIAQSDNVYPEKAKLGENYILTIRGDGLWGSENGSLFPEDNTLDAGLLIYANAADPIFQDRNNSFWGGILLTTAKEDEERVIDEFNRDSRLYVAENRLTLMDGLQKALEQTFIRVQNI
jgi:hypothetical protein